MPSVTILLASLAASMPVAAGAQTIDPYVVTTRPITYRTLPLDGGSAPALPFNSTYVGSSNANLPFEVTFFDTKYPEARVGASGYITFGRNSDATIAGSPNYAQERYSFEIPSEWKTPNRLLAVWWGDLNCSSPATIRSQTLGQPPNRKYVIEWRGCWPYNPFGFREGSVNMQIWFTEGSSTIETRYGVNVPGTNYATYKFAVGMMTDIPQGGYASTGFSTFPCSAAGPPGTLNPPSCGPANWLTNTAVIYSQEADLVMESVNVKPAGYPGIAMPLSATVYNRGSRTAKNFKVRFYLSSKQTLDGTAIPLGDATGGSYVEDGSAISGGVATLANGKRATFTLDGLFPSDLEEGVWYVLAEADPAMAVTEIIRDDNVRTSAPVGVGIGTPDLGVGEITVPARIEPGAQFSMSWLAENVGSDRALDVPYTIRLSSGEGVSLTDRELLSSTFSLNAGDELTIDETVRMPADVSPGLYRIGVIIDPHSLVVEVDKGNNIGVSESLQVASSLLEVVTDELPVADLGSPWCKRLEAAGGNGSYEWSVATGSKLPPGLQLETMSGSAGTATMLCGRPNALGTFEFTLAVQSAGLKATKTLELEVSEGAMPLEVATGELPVALFDSAYSTKLMASGGLAPYGWNVRSGTLPAGLHLSSDGRLVGSPVEAGTFGFSVQAEDARGQLAFASLYLVVAEPTRLSCLTRALPALQVGQSYSGELLGAGGTKPYRWSTRDSRRLSSGVGESAVQLGNVPPPGFTLDSEGTIAGTPEQVGRFLWTVELVDSTQTTEICTIVVDVPVEQGLTVVTTGLLPAVAGHSFEARLDAAGGRAPYKWKLMVGSRLPNGIRLTEDGRLEGTPSLTDLAGDPARSFSFAVEVRDAENVRGLGPVSLVLLAEPPRVSGDGDSNSTKKSGGGCQQSGGAASFTAMTAVLSLALLRRRKRG